MAYQDVLSPYDYGILNPLQVEPSLLPELTGAVALAPPPMADSAERLPQLIQLKAQTIEVQAQLNTQLARQAELGEPLTLCGLLRCDTSAERLAGDFKQRLILRDRHQGRLLLRCYDPRVLAQLRRILSSAQCDGLLGPIQRWTYHLAHQWHTLERQGPAYASAWRPDAAQRQQIERIGLINRVHAKLQAQPPSDPHVQGADIDAWLVRGYGHGLQHRDDLIEFALHGLTRHAAFDRHRRIQALLDGARNGERPYTAASRELTEADWQQIITDLDTPQAEAL